MKVQRAFGMLCDNRQLGARRESDYTTIATGEQPENSSMETFGSQKAAERSLSSHTGSHR